MAFNHALDTCLRRRVGRLGNLPFGGGYRRGCHDDAPLPVAIRGVTGHGGGRKADTVEGTGQVDRDDPDEVLERVGGLEAPVTPDRPSRPGDSRAGDQTSQGTTLHRHFDRGDDLLLVGDIGVHVGTADFVRQLRPRSLLKVDNGDARPLLGEMSCACRAKSGRTPGDHHRRLMDLHASFAPAL
jgi:hypothetical protein